MLKFSANYAKTNNNFVLQNIPNRLSQENEYAPIICVLKNILQRGCPTSLSKYLAETIGGNLLDEDFERLHLIDNEAPHWENVIKGDEENNYFPAREFFYEIIPNYLREFSFIQQLILPEAAINEITGIETNEFYESRVDFYLPQAKLVIEIDGCQHKGDIDQEVDKKRDEHLYSNGITTVRIDTGDIREKSTKFNEKIEEIRACLIAHKKELYKYDNFLKGYLSDEDKSKLNQALIATAVIRFQITILQLLECGKLDVKADTWNIRILERDIHGFADIALKDLLLWLKNLCKLYKISFSGPKLNIELCHIESELYNNDKADEVKIDFSVLKRWTNECERFRKTVFVRNDYYEEKNYFKVSTAEPIKYRIVLDGDDSDYNSLIFVLENIFGFNEFTPGQLPIITNALACVDTVGLLPTGSGKSLCYQFVALLQPCVSFVVDPIKSLMLDQKDNLDRKHINRTNYISSDQNGEEKGRIQKEFAEGKYLFVWISPERFQTKTFREYLEQLNTTMMIGLAVIDEVHCISEWGHDFRTSYLNLSKTIRKHCPSAVFLGLTATASVNVLKDILIEFEIKRGNVKTLPSFTRKELTFEVIKDNGQTINGKKLCLEKLLDKLTRHRDVLTLSGKNTRSGIIFTRSVNGQNGCYKLANDLSARYGTKVYWYSGKVPEINKRRLMTDKAFNKYKNEVQKAFKNNAFPLLVATKAFGMGIDKSNIRYTIHFGMPGSMEALYQEAGRAGRDKKPAGCYVLYSKENKGKEHIDKIFDLNSTVDDISEIYEKIQFDGRDIFSNMFLWLSNQESFEQDYHNMEEIVEKVAKPNSSELIIKCKDFHLSLAQLQKIIYKLSIIGIVDDWTIKDWNQEKGFIVVDFCEYTDESIMNGLLKYIKKYDKDFDINNENKETNQYHEILCQDLPVYRKAYKILIRWQYENIAYNRRQSIKNLADLCEGFTDSDYFQNILEDYFKFTDVTYSFDDIAENPKKYDNWFSTFLKCEDEKKEQLTVSELKSLKANLSRFLESYRYNIGLNWISGMVRLILKEYEDVDGKKRLQSAFEQISKLPEEDQVSILNKTLDIGKIYLDAESREDLSEMIIKNYKAGAEKVYIELEDNYSLNYLLGNYANRLRNIGDGLL